MTDDNIEQQFKHVVDDLTQEFAADASPDDVQEVVADVRNELEPPAKITDFLPVLVRRYARETLLDRRRLLAG